MNKQTPEPRKGSDPVKPEAISLSNSEPRDRANMKLWDAVSRTKPSHTTKVNQRGGFTAIAAQYQIMEATRQFGPIGEGWGYETGEFVRMDRGGWLRLKMNLSEEQKEAVSRIGLDPFDRD